MPPDLPTLSAAFLTGLLGSGHCLLMCGGVAAGLTAASGAAPGRATWQAALQLNLGRVLGYVLAGLLMAGVGASMVRAIDIQAVSVVPRLLLGLVLMLAGLRALDRRGRLQALIGRPGQRVWQHLRPLTRHLLPANSAPRRLALGALWGWLPCGLSWLLLIAALFTVDALDGALTMLAFGLGTMPAMLPATWGSARLARRLSTGSQRRVLAGAVILAGALTLAAPWLAHMPGVQDALAILGCQRTPRLS